YYEPMIVNDKSKNNKVESTPQTDIWNVSSKDVANKGDVNEEKCEVRLDWGDVHGTDTEVDKGNDVEGSDSKSDDDDNIKDDEEDSDPIWFNDGLEGSDDDNIFKFDLHQIGPTRSSRSVITYKGGNSPEITIRATNKFSQIVEQFSVSQPITTNGDNFDIETHSIGASQPVFPTERVANVTAKGFATVRGRGRGRARGGRVPLLMLQPKKQMKGLLKLQTFHKY
ncbi:hypothetical protein ACMD2_26432, partial [Ananas comosus]